MSTTRPIVDRIQPIPKFGQSKVVPAELCSTMATKPSFLLQPPSMAVPSRRQLPPHSLVRAKRSTRKSLNDAAKPLFLQEMQSVDMSPAQASRNVGGEGPEARSSRVAYLSKSRSQRSAFNKTRSDLSAVVASNHTPICEGKDSSVSTPDDSENCVEIKIPKFASTARRALSHSRSMRGRSSFSVNTSRAVVNDKEESGWMSERTQARLQRIINHKAVTAVLHVVTLYALFAEDIRLAATDAGADLTFSTLSFVAMILFGVEFVINCLSRPKYIGQSYFWMDLVCTLSLVADVEWMWTPLTGGGSKAGNFAVRVGRLSRAGTRASRIIRLIRSLMVLRTLKAIKVKEDNKDKNQSSVKVAKRAMSIHSISAIYHQDTKTVQRAEPSRVGERLSDLTTRRVIVIVLLMAIALPLLDPTQYFSTDSHREYSELDVLHRDLQLQPNAPTTRLTMQKYFIDDSQLLQLNMYGIDDTESYLRTFSGYAAGSLNGNLGSFRDFELLTVRVTECYDNATSDVIVGQLCTSQATYSERRQSQLQAMFNIGRTVFTIIVLIVAAFLFTNDAEILLIRPIETMVQTVKTLAENPLAILTDEQEETKDKDTEGKQKKSKLLRCCLKPPRDERLYETEVLDQTLRRIAALLQVGFGDAGAQIIAQNLKESKAGQVNPLVDGRKMSGIFGFCDIRQFTDVTECLQEEVMVFVNRIAEIVHKATHKYTGAANKNIGDAFLLVWTLNKTDIQDHMKAGNANTESEAVQELEVQLTDNALYAFMKIVVDIHNANEYGVLSNYSNHEKIRERFPKGFEVRLGFGLHHGWAIEGTIGSQYKIDASYLSPNVNISARLEAATKQYGVTLLISGEFVAKLSEEARSLCRKIDRVTVKGSMEPIDLYTVDIYSFPPSFGCTCDDPTHFLDADFATDFSVESSQEGKPKGFLEVFQSGVETYLAGDWPSARSALEAALKLKPDDGPALTLLRYMASLQYKRPLDWSGFRELTEK